MSQSFAIWLLILLAFIAATLPCLIQRLLSVLPLRGGKSLAWRLAELVVWEFSQVGGGGKGIKKRGDRRHYWNTFARFPVYSQRNLGLIAAKAKSIPFKHLEPKCGIRNKFRHKNSPCRMW